jgi:ribonuclease VapC
MRIAVDTSALVAILGGEPEAVPFTHFMSRHELSISAGSLVEALRVVRLRQGDAGVAKLWALLDAQKIGTVSVDPEQVRLADEGMRRFGRGRGSPPAVLNFGDLFAYALARHLDAPLLFKGDDFPHTDVRPALPALAP